MTRSDLLVALSALVLAPLFKAVEFIVLPVAYRPDLLVVLAISVGWTCEFWTAVPGGFIVGLVEDLLTGRALGSRAISLALAASTSTLLKRFVSPDAALSKVIAALVSAAVADAMNFAILRGMGIPAGLYNFLRVIWPATVAWSAVLVLPLDSLNRRFALLLGRLWPAGEEKRKEAAV